LEFEKYGDEGAYHWSHSRPALTNTGYSPPLAARYDALLSRLPPGSRCVLDVGCGDGYLLYRASLVCRAAALHGVDPSARGVAMAAGRLARAGCRALLGTAGAGDLPYGTGSFDAVLMADVIEHLEEPERALDEVRRVLAPGGVLLLSTPFRQRDFRWDERYHVHEYDDGELRDLLGEFFASVELSACCPMSWMRFWRRGALCRMAVRWISLLAGNPMTRSSGRPTRDYGQLVAACTG
jgi:SAM-dependent methyltransferase